MHAHIEQLLSLRDGEPVAADAAAHVRECAECGELLARLHATRARLQALPAVVAGTGGDWIEIERRIAERRAAPLRRARTGLVAAAAAVATLALLAGLRLQDRATHPADAFSDIESAVVAVDPPTIEDLQHRSMQLEQLLAALPERPAVERAATALPIDALEAQVQWVDHRLSESEAAKAGPRETVQLWRDRIELMNSLVQLRYVEAQRQML
jgi:hypothetical protein